MTDNINIPIGYIFQKAKVLERNAHKNLWILKNNSHKNRLLLKDSHISKGRTINRGECLENLVLIGFGKKLFRVALANYQNDLISHYYCYSNGCYRPRRGNWRIWQSRWQNEYGKDFLKNVTLKKDIRTTNDLYLDIFWLKGGDYILPVFGYKDLGMLQGIPLFCPELFTDKYLPARSVYKTDGLYTLPQMYMANITGTGLTGNISKNICIFFHGFTYPAKWHFGIWKHVLALASDSKEKERTFWEKLWDTNFSVQNDLFKSCKTANNEKSCNETTCLSLNLFNNIHSEINNLCRKYLEQFVTSFDGNTINNIALFNGPFNSTKIVLTYMKQYNNIFQKTVLYGTCYDWNDTRPVFHINPVTMFLDNRFDKDWLSKNIVEDENKRNSKNIFDGYLNGIRKCRQI